jgi:hypothetical protein
MKSATTRSATAKPAILTLTRTKAARLAGPTRSRSTKEKEKRS